MSKTDIFVLILCGINMVLGFLSINWLNPVSNGFGWFMGGLYYYLWKKGVTNDQTHKGNG